MISPGTMLKFVSGGPSPLLFAEQGLFEETYDLGAFTVARPVISDSFSDFSELR
jgi:hypothetical protein